MRNPYLFLLLTILVISCRKEPPTQPTPPTSSAVFTFGSSAGVCNTTVSGVYVSGTSLDVSHNVIVQVNVTSPGNYSVITSTISGIQFSTSGTFTSAGTQSIILRGAGTPTNPGTFSFLFTEGSSACSFDLTINNAVPGVLADNDHMLFGNPSNAVMIVDSFSNYLMRKTYYATSYSRDRGIPNWVSWHLYSPDLGSTPRQDDFRPDNTLPAGWYQVPEFAYSGSGFDRGHNTPSGDRTSRVAANSSTFLMTNMIPQAPVLNQQTWAILEDSLRRLVNAGFELYIIMGSYGNGGTGNLGFATTIDGGRVAVPASVWKIAVVIPNGNNDTSRVNTSTRVIAVNIPNTNSVSSNWKNYRVSTDAIETATGYDLLNRLPAAVQTILEARVDNL